MTDSELIEKLTSIVGQSIVDVSYIQTKFHFKLDGYAQGDWTNINPDLFVLHSPEWQIKLSNGKTLFITGEQLSEENLASKFSIKDSTKMIMDDTVLNIPKAFKWLDILDNPITKFRLWKRIIRSSRVLGFEFNIQYQDYFQIVDLVCGNSIFSLTLMSGDIGDMVFYPTGYFGGRVGVLINKTVCTSHTVYDLTMRMASTYKSK